MCGDRINCDYEFTNSPQPSGKFKVNMFLNIYSLRVQLLNNPLVIHTTNIKKKNKLKSIAKSHI